ncbi:tRNA uridine-5-carboxymethylaminomethyl(34) synthesis GTPase MnmE [Paracoccus onubensis]|uniref:tRNA uridine-5-carboxymethylaminomethyl(34) synthesis GTPase MnmE n=1 Tax=Paracoccus onubensis TaxID=1675788 RepID=UPI00272FB78D|nr:tRNA uridine-5-carboxymethylaminomethyl(34) synthesis GTPase MnmE [Paracoccus onubensis]MDP0928118.1 tRNA uridine-5-carboxymethylaminomethyl(34) synthesis GTPase MnmE [Paracoccus onubensis]
MDLIFSEATSPGRGGVSVIRLSGDNARTVAEKLTGPLTRPRYAELRDIRVGDETIDRALVLWFEEGSSFTGEEVVELHLHGAPVIVKRISRALLEMGLRWAEAGEFTKRAFLNGRMDLAEVEGLGDLLEAETEVQRQLATRVASGELSDKTEAWRGALIRAGALVEASVDFADEEVPEQVPLEAYEILSQLRDDLDSEINGFSATERLRKGLEVAVIGPPNAGKSSLINRIARRDIALVSDIEGTTRDIIEVRLDLYGLAVTILDTAGLRESIDEIEKLGVGLAKKRAMAADLRLHLSETGDVVTDLWKNGDISIRTKSDLGDSIAGDIAISSSTGDGIDVLLSRLYDRLSLMVVGARTISHERQLTALVDASACLSDIEALPPELLAESIRAAATSLDRLLGRIGAEEYLGMIFSSFCIGK